MTVLIVPSSLDSGNEVSSISQDEGGWREHDVEHATTYQVLSTCDNSKGLHVTILKVLGACDILKHRAGRGATFPSSDSLFFYYYGSVELNYAA